MQKKPMLTLIAALAWIASAATARAQETIDFENFNEGDIVSQVFGDAGGGPIGVNGLNPRFGSGTNAAMIFDSDCDGGCTGDDPDLGASNETFGGPGIGEGGESGQPFANDRALGNTLIVTEDLDSSDPDDEGRRDGVMITLDFSALGSVTLIAIDVLDIEPRTEEGAVANLYGAGDVLLASVPIPTTGNNGLDNIDLGPTAGVVRLEVILNGSGAIDNVTFLGAQEECGNDETEGDEQCDGVDDEQCPGECRVDCTCPVCGDGIVDEGEECDDGNSNDEDDCRNDCTLPEPFCGDGNVDEGEECDDGNNESGDGCSATCEEEERGGEGCTPGYWKQPHHFDSWTGVAPTDNFNTTFGTSATFNPDKCGSSNPTLLEALQCKGGALGSLARHAVAALLNALSGGVDFGFTADGVKDLVQDAIESGEVGDAKDRLASENELGCPLN